MGQFDEAKDRIVQGAEWMHRAVCDVEGRYQRAADAGAELAAEVYRFTFTEQDREVADDALKAAYTKFMALHSGNFSEPSPVGVQ